MKCIILILCLIGIPLLLCASKGMEFVDLHSDARGNSLSFSDLVTIDDINALSYNPASLLNIKNSSVSLSHLTWIAGFYKEQAGFAKKFDFCTIGILASYLYNPSISRTDIYGQDLGKMDNHNININVGIAKNISLFNQHIGIGINIQYFRSVLDEYRIHNINGDIGLLYRPKTWKAFGLGLCVQNIGLPIEYDNEKTSLPINIQCSISYQFLNTSNYMINCYGSSGFNIDNDLYFPVGIEIGLYKTLFFRSGYYIAQNHLRTLSFGMGMEFYNISVDFGYLPNIGSDLTYIGTIGYKW